MAQVTGGMGLKLAGKVGGLVYVQLNGGTYTRKLPHRKKEMWTPRMLLNLQRFRQVNNFCGQFKYSVIPQIWNVAALANFSKVSNFGKVAAKKMSGYAFFLKSNMAAFGPDGSLGDAKKLRFSTGNLVWPEGFEAHRPDPDANTIDVNWPKELHTGGIHLRDELMVITSVDGQYSDITTTGIERIALTGSFELPGQLAIATHVYLFFGARDRRDYSESVCFEV